MMKYNGKAIPKVSPAVPCVGGQDLGAAFTGTSAGSLTLLWWHHCGRGCSHLSPITLHGFFVPLLQLCINIIFVLKRIKRVDQIMDSNHIFQFILSF